MKQGWIYLIFTFLIIFFFLSLIFNFLSFLLFLLFRFWYVWLIIAIIVYLVKYFNNGINTKKYYDDGADYIDAEYRVEGEDDDEK